MKTSDAENYLATNGITDNPTAFFRVWQAIITASGWLFPEKGFVERRLAEFRSKASIPIEGELRPVEIAAGRISGIAVVPPGTQPEALLIYNIPEHNWVVESLAAFADRYQHVHIT